MDQTQPKRRFRFGLRTLLLLVALSAGAFGLYRLFPSPGLSGVDFAMTEAEVIDQLGKPHHTMTDRNGRTYWYYAYHENGMAYNYVVFSTPGDLFPDARVVRVGWTEEEAESSPEQANKTNTSR